MALQEDGINMQLIELRHRDVATSTVRYSFWWIARWLDSHQGKAVQYTTTIR